MLFIDRCVWIRLEGLKIVRSVSQKIMISSSEIRFSDAVERRCLGAAREGLLCEGGQEGTRGCHQQRLCPHQRDTRCHGAWALWAKLGAGRRDPSAVLDMANGPPGPGSTQGLNSGSKGNELETGLGRRPHIMPLGGPPWRWAQGVRQAWCLSSSRDWGHSLGLNCGWWPRGGWWRQQLGLVRSVRACWCPQGCDRWWVLPFTYGILMSSWPLLWFCGGRRKACWSLCIPQPQSAGVFGGSH